MSALDALVSAGKPKGRHGCRVPGCDKETRATVAVLLRRFKPGMHTGGDYDGSVSRQLSLCEAHAVEVWGKIMDAFPQ